MYWFCDMNYKNEKDKQSSTNPVELPFHNSATM